MASGLLNKYKFELNYYYCYKLLIMEAKLAFLEEQLKTLIIRTKIKDLSQTASIGIGTLNLGQPLNS